MSRLNRTNDKYLKYIRELPCLRCHGYAEPHHIRDSKVIPREFSGGVGLKSFDLMAIPLCRNCHSLIHDGKDLGIDIAKEVIRYLVGYINLGG